MSHREETAALQRRPMYLIRGDTTLYGRLERVMDEPGMPIRLWLALDGGRSLAMVFAARPTRDLLDQLRRRVGERIGVACRVQWCSTDWEIVSAVVTDVLLYRETSLSEAFRALRQAAGPDAWRDPSLLRELREEE